MTQHDPESTARAFFVGILCMMIILCIGIWGEDLIDYFMAEEPVVYYDQDEVKIYSMGKP